MLNEKLRDRTVEDYDRIFARERAVQYPMVDAIEERMGYAVDQEKLLRAAAALACPLKVNPPNWQHGRVLYALAREYLARNNSYVPACILDVGTAKGFSALCLQWALAHSGVHGRVHSVDVIHPDERTWRNTVLECERQVPTTLMEILAGWPEADSIKFYGMTAVSWLVKTSGQRVGFAFVDGKHSGAVVAQEARMLVDRQVSGDVIVFDDVHIPDVKRAARVTTLDYEQKVVEVIPGKRAYMICRKS